jgi:cytochrome c-type biogenesis protein
LIFQGKSIENSFKSILNKSVRFGRIFLFDGIFHAFQEKLPPKEDSMKYFILFLEGITAFISPCMLPMLPVYLGYFAGQEENRRKTLLNAVGFVCGFTLVFVLLGAFSGSLGVFVFKNKRIINTVFGTLLILLGLNYAGILKIGFLNSIFGHSLGFKKANLNFFSSLLFGILFSAGWTPCVGTFLGSALMLAANSQTVSKGIFMLFVFSMGLGIPFILSAVIIDRLKSAFDFIKRNYRIINLFSGILLAILGILMIAGLFG